VIGGKRIGRIHGARDQTYTSGVVCAKSPAIGAHPSPGSAQLSLFDALVPREAAIRTISWDEALDRVADNFLSSSASSDPKACGLTSTPAPWVS